jgi:hypothetical protein
MPPICHTKGRQALLARPETPKLAALAHVPCIPCCCIESLLLLYEASCG